MALGLLVGTLIFLGLEGIVTLGVVFTGTSGKNALKHTLATTTVVCLWLIWAIVYMAQMHPLIRPVLAA
ncbi:hypothetical protein WJX72_001069 [[Myrmecia] bisecta]|uniref:Uncharacterized protein n=1 Tax=[Myrmecia] bisecta TaxID=41462 RepID=A0AAW1PKN8_9CHLO